MVILKRGMIVPTLPETFFSGLLVFLMFVF